jgi:hypothetical protein
MLHWNGASGRALKRDDEILSMARSSAGSVMRLGESCGLKDRAKALSDMMLEAATSSERNSVKAYEFCRLALEFYIENSAIGKMMHVVNARLWGAACDSSVDHQCCVKAIADACGDLAYFVHLVWQGLNLEIAEKGREAGIYVYRGVEVSETVLTAYRDNTGKKFSWPVFASFTENREEAEEHGRAWRGGISIVFTLMSWRCPRLRDGNYWLPPFAEMGIDGVFANEVIVHEASIRPRHVRRQCRAVSDETRQVEERN